MSAGITHLVSIAVDDRRGTRRTFDGLWCSAEAEATSLRRANKAKCEIWNLSDEMHAWVCEAKLVDVTIGQSADDARRGRLFVGDVVGVERRRENRDRVTLIRAGDAEVALRSARCSATLGRGATWEQVLGVVSAALGVDVGYRDPALPLTEPLLEGAVLVGYAAYLLDEVCASIGATWSVRNGALQVLRGESGGTDETAIVISETTGMHGSPEPILRRGKLVGVRVVTEATPWLQPGVPVLIDSEEIYGYHVVRSAKTKASNFGTDWATEVETRAVLAGE